MTKSKGPRGAQSYVQGAGEIVYARFLTGEVAGELGFVQAMDAFEHVEKSEAWPEIEHQADLAEGARKFQQRDAYGGELRALHGEIQRNGGDADATFGARDDD
jgi:hypothetical protein